MPRSETEAHHDLKRRALIWAQQHRYTVCATEVRLPHGRCRADVVAYRPQSERQPLADAAGRGRRLVRQPVVGTTAVLECKQARPDFLKDSQTRSATLTRLQKLDDRRQTFERLLKVHYPSLRQGDSLFPEYQSLKTGDLEHRAYHRVLREIGILQRRLYGRTKFEDLVRARCADLYYLVAAPGILQPAEVPVHWGLLVVAGDGLVLVRKPLGQAAAVPTRLAVLQQIARASTARLNREFGIGPIGPPSDGSDLLDLLD
ncbi:hypothetical protein HQ590_13515 [bacterium]|nr:hypothetical protein [bacterium]